MAKETFILRTEWWDALSDLTIEERDAVVQAIFFYHSDRRGDIEMPTHPSRLVWKLIEPSLRATGAAYDKRRDTSAENGRNGGRPRKDAEKPNNLPENLNKPNNPIVSVSDSASESVTVSEPAAPVVTEGAKQFAEFWAAYDKPVEEDKCKHAWYAMTLDERALALARAPDYAASKPELRYRKNPLNWLTDKGWKDKIIPYNTKPEKEPPREQPSPIKTVTAAEIAAKYGRPK